MRELSVVIVNYNGRSTLLETIRSLQGQEGVRPHIVVVDDGSSDGSVEMVRAAFPEVRIHREPRNTRQVNRLRNLGLNLAHTDRVFLTDNDVVFEPDALLRLLEVMEVDDRVAICIPRLMYLEEPARVYQAGTRVHYCGATEAMGRDRIAGQLENRPRVAIGGGIALIDRKKLWEVGGFDEGYELAWGDDGELHQRFLLAGYLSMVVPAAVGYHEYKPFGRARHYRASGQVYNRWRFITTHYAVRTLLVIAPALVLFEVVQCGFFLMRGIPHLYLKGTWKALRHLPQFVRRRREIQALREVADRDVLSGGPLYVRPAGGGLGRLVAFGVRIVSRLLSYYWRLVRPLLAKRTVKIHVPT
ncbi:glycosyltransferase [Rhodocaloribacter litoris]|uniref:glycosyltransferase n=1 Tax=Rhodocaloribacter litoris TaxID=2558931 RepID=UPI00141FEFAE|nr:glycosyltransferase [Rhodocaloribacter litoris]QXD16202.1 glycosyltransferase [Rhodocaloribacter litoris]